MHSWYVVCALLRQTAYDESELNVLQATVDSDADSDDEIGSFHDDDGPDSSDQEVMDEDADSLENGAKTKNHDLEWDSSTVSYWAEPMRWSDGVELVEFVQTGFPMRFHS